MTDREKLEKILEIAKHYEDECSDRSLKAMEEGNTIGMLVHQAEAGAYMRIRFTIEDALDDVGVYSEQSNVKGEQGE